MTTPAWPITRYQTELAYSELPMAHIPRAAKYTYVLARSYMKRYMFLLGNGFQAMMRCGETNGRTGWILTTILLGYVLLLIQPCMASTSAPPHESHGDCELCLAEDTGCTIDAVAECDSGPWLIESKGGQDPDSKAVAISSSFSAAKAKQPSIRRLDCSDIGKTRYRRAINLHFCVFLI